MSAKAASKVFVVTGKRKTAIARATVVYPGRGRVFINSIPLEIHMPEVARWKIMTPILVAGKNLIDNIDIYVQVKGGGFMGQAEAAAIAIARALVNLGGEEVKQKIMSYDRRLLVGDPRQTEPKKFGGYSARRKKQKSYR
ncbi:MAG: 30S ribosomal protein S9 [Candidatus Methanomethylicota archaeon]|uniref:30S ribosomal protein S9 n=1 Tax=Thermoproteota archaeon TaxID=2056631 RepID=A0A497EZ56_9CREN|nr:MAG: 30S ribosomal protein S9 [Candidatus Verstraetearchaeota archaeon]RLE52476.1 MAG: 30S ribosomal protein S9 [Candidatus Verstraetearchaeota archaeon]